MRKILIAFPTGDMVHMGAVTGWLQLVHYSAGRGIHLMMINERAVVEIARRNCVLAAEKTDATHILFLDSDVVAPHDTVERLIAADKAIVGASYPMRRMPHRWTHTNLDGTHELQSGLYEVARMPAGCLMIDMRVFDGLDKPYFRFPWNAAGDFVGEDNDFCDRVRLLGYTVWCDADLSRQLRHLGEYAYGGRDL